MMTREEKREALRWLKALGGGTLIDTSEVSDELAFVITYPGTPAGKEKKQEAAK